jgi:hypothetical protein
MTIEGDLVVRLAWDGRGVRDVSIRSSRPAIAGVLAGRSAAEAAAIVPRLFGVCAQAQGAAAAAAIGAAQQGVPASTAASLAIAVETVFEDLWHLLACLPERVGAPSDVGTIGRARRLGMPLLAPGAPDQARADAIVAALCSIAGERVFDEPPAAFLARHDASALHAWALGAATPPAIVARSLLAARPALGASDVLALFDLDRPTVERVLLPSLARDAAFARTPDLGGEPRETGALDVAGRHPGIASLARQARNGAATRLFARLVQLATTLEALRGGDVAGVDAWSPAPDEGVAIVRTARGLLVHHARVRRDRVAAYAIVAPTEWNFHPRGALARGLATLASSDRASLARDASLLVQLADACVACTVEVDDA